MITIDGSLGEGGGQILRTSLALSLVTGQPFRIERIRAGRKKPGLLRQHLTAVEAACAVGRAEADGATPGSTALTFQPGKPTAGEHTFSVGTAGSTTLVFQTVLPALLMTGGTSTLRLAGGTHNPSAPPFDFLDRVFFPMLRRLGASAEATLERPGFYPAGGGSFTVTVIAPSRWERLDLVTRGEITSRHARAIVTGLPRHVADRELAVVAEKLGWGRESLEAVALEGGHGIGNVVTLEVSSATATEVVTGFGEKGVSAEAVAGHAVDAMRAYLAADVPVGEHLADQLLLPLAVGAGGRFRTAPLSRHATTNVDVIRRFLDVPIAVAPDGGSVIVTVGAG